MSSLGCFRSRPIIAPATSSHLSSVILRIQCIRPCHIDGDRRKSAVLDLEEIAVGFSDQAAVGFGVLNLKTHGNSAMLRISDVDELVMADSAMMGPETFEHS